MGGIRRGSNKGKAKRTNHTVKTPQKGNANNAAKKKFVALKAAGTKSGHVIKTIKTSTSSSTGTGSADVSKN